MKQLSFEQMELIEGGAKHTLKEHLICVTWGILAEPLGPLGVAAAMIACYASFD
ncbi:MAG: hypothetical protein JXB49_25065 [Bacteroidales bacterium]|nr:hypothetical protein [Bacteroidales bacterium]